MHETPRWSAGTTCCAASREAAAYVPVERFALSPQCGFPSTAAGNLLTEDERWRKLELGVETARQVWG